MVSCAPSNQTSYSSGRQCGLCSQSHIQQHGSSLLCWLQNLRTGRHLWRVREKKHRKGQEKSRWKPVWSEYRIGTSGKFFLITCGSKRASRDTPLGSNFFHFYAILGKISQNNRLASASLGNPRSATDLWYEILYTYRNTDIIFKKW